MHCYLASSGDGSRTAVQYVIYQAISTQVSTFLVSTFIKTTGVVDRFLDACKRRPLQVLSCNHWIRFKGLRIGRGVLHMYEDVKICASINSMVSMTRHDI